jgi:hypothetical protein
MTDWALALIVLRFLIIRGVMAKALKTPILFSALRAELIKPDQVALRIIINKNRKNEAKRVH